MKKLVFFFFSIILLSIFGACSKSNSITSGYSMVNGFPKYDPPIVLTQGMKVSVGGESVFYKDHTVENNAYTEWYKNNMGIIWKPKWVAPDDETHLQKLSLAMASGDLPDLIYAYGNNFTELATGGALVDVSPLLDKYASKLVKNIFEETSKAIGGGDIFAAGKFNNVNYGIPLILDIWAGGDNTTWIRQDILTELGMDMPKNLAELEKTFAAYKKKYSNKYPMYLTNDFGLPYYGAQVVMNALGAPMTRWIKTDDGKLAYGSIQPETRQALQLLAQWYKAGYISPEFVVEKNSKNLTAGNTLVNYAPWWFVHNVYADLVKNNSKAVMRTIPLFKENKNSAYFDGAKVLGALYGISVKSAHPEAIILAYNENMESKMRDQQDLRSKFDFKYPFEVYGKLNGYTKEGPYFFNFPDAKDSTQIDSVYLNPGVQINQRATDLYNTYKRIVDNIDKKGADKDLSEYDQKFKKEAEERLNGEALWDNIRLFAAEDKAGLHKYDLYSGPVLASQKENGAELTTLEQTVFTKIITGQADISAFDDFIKNWKAKGGDQITKEVNDWYKATHP